MPNRTFDVAPHAEAVDYDDSDWRALAPADTQLRLSQGRVCFNWYRISVTIPDRVGDYDPTGASVVFEVAIDDYAEVWVDGELPHALGDAGGPVVGGFNAPEPRSAHRGRPSGRAVPDRGVRDQRPDLGLAAQLHLDAHRVPRLLRARPRPPSGAAELEVDRADRRLDAIVRPTRALERVAGGFDFTEGPVWSRDGALLFSSPNTNAIYRWTPDGPRHRVPLQERLHRHRHRSLSPSPAPTG